MAAESYTSAITYDTSPFIYCRQVRTLSSNPVQVQPDVTLRYRLRFRHIVHWLLCKYIAFGELPGNPSIYEDRYTIGRWPRAVWCCIGTMDDFGVYAWPALIRWPALYIDKIAVEISTIEESHSTYTYERLMSPTFKLVIPHQRYVWDSNLGVWLDQIR